MTPMHRVCSAALMAAAILISPASAQEIANNKSNGPIRSSRIASIVPTSIVPTKITTTPPSNWPLTSFGTDTVDGSVIADAQPTGDEATTRDNIQMSGRNVGDLLNAKNITWGWFQGGFDNPAATHIGSNGKPQFDYIAHHEPFQYYPQTA
jgi:hypothetical protein